MAVTQQRPRPILLHRRTSMADDQAIASASMDMQDKILNKVEGQGGRSRGGGRHGRGGGGRGGRSSDVSRALSKLLRHQAENAGIKLDDEGYASLDKVVRFPNLILFHNFHALSHAKTN